MMELQLRALSDYAYADGVGKLFILGEFRYIFGKQLPVIHKRMFLTFRVVGDAVEGLQHELKVDLTDADGNSILSRQIEGQIKFLPIGPGQHGKIQAQVIIEIGGTKFETWGDYRCEIFVNQRHLGGVPVTISKAPGQQPKKKKKKSR